MWKLGCVRSATHAGIAHPLLNLQSWKSFELITHALQNNSARSSFIFRNFIYEIDSIGDIFRLPIMA